MKDIKVEIVGLTVETLSSRLVKAALELWDTDRHNFSARPCPTCRVMTAMIGQPFGCCEVRKKRDEGPA